MNRWFGDTLLQKMSMDDAMQTMRDEMIPASSISGGQMWLLRATVNWQTAAACENRDFR